MEAHLLPPAFFTYLLFKLLYIFLTECNSIIQNIIWIVIFLTICVFYKFNKEN